MSDAIIHVEHLGKRYRIKHQAEPQRYTALRDVIADKFKRLFRSRLTSPATPPSTEDFWALKDVSFEIKPGEVVGIIGRNGAGKSTLLKILSRITEPTEGRARIRGRVASLLEVGTGFHPELTGRENIFLNGAILGMYREEIKRKFDEIVMFAEVEKFLDTPVKRYSSGMYVRLAFAVAAHLEPEILIIDEVLAVGDASFQRKCLGKMKNVSEVGGQTVLFVSHSMAAVRSLCQRVIWLDGGRVVGAGVAPEVIESYLKESRRTVTASEIHLDEDPSKDFQVVGARVMKVDGEPAKDFTCDEEFRLELSVVVRQPLPGLYGYLGISKRDGMEVLVSDSYDGGENPLDNLSMGKHKLVVTLPARLLGPGDYVANFSFASAMSAKGFLVECPDDLVSFRLEDPLSRRGNNRGGFFSALLSWEVNGHCQSSETGIRDHGSHI